MRAKQLVPAALLGLVALDGLGSLFLIEDGAFRGVPLPPYGALTNPRQEEWLSGALADPDASAGIGRYDAELGWTLLPESASDDGRYTVGALGARGPREYSRAKPDGTTRVLCFGDSFTFCEELPDSEAWPAMLEALDARVEALNFGVGGYGTDQALLRMRRLAPELSADVIAMGLLLENVGRNVNRYRPRWYPRSAACGVKPRFALGEAGALRLVPNPFATRVELLAAVADGSVLARTAADDFWVGRPPFPRALRFSSLARLAGGFLAERERDPERLWRDPDGEPFRVTLALLEAFREEARALGARPLVLVFGMRADVLGLARGDAPYWELLLAELERRGIEHVDLVPPLAAFHLETLRDPAKGSIFFGGHLSGVGNHVVARELAAWIDLRDD